MKRKVNILGCFFVSLPLLAGCTYNPFIADNHTTGSPVAAAVGAGIGAGGVALLGGSKLTMGLAGIAGGTVGYYVSTLRYASGGVLQGGGKVYKIGDYLGIYIPTDKVFEPNTADFLPQAKPILDSAASVLKRYPNRSILISGNTSGFYRARWEQDLSERRAQKVSAYLWNAGISQNNPYLHFNKLHYVGHGDYFPLAKDITNKGVRENSRIQITSYPAYCDLLLEKKVVDARPVMDPGVVTGVTMPPPIACDTMDSEGHCLDDQIKQG